jgi:hypothetical protein
MHERRQRKRNITTDKTMTDETMTDETTTDETPLITEETATIKILQCNLRKSNTKTHSILNDPHSEQFTALLVQEQSWVRKLKSSVMHNTSWTLIESTTKAKRHPRSAIYVNKRKLTSPFYEQKHFPFSDVTAVAISKNSKLIETNSHNQRLQPARKRREHTNTATTVHAPTRTR